MQEVAKLRWLPVDIRCAMEWHLRAADHHWTQAATHALRSKHGAERARTNRRQRGARRSSGCLLLCSDPGNLG